MQDFLNARTTVPDHVLSAMCLRKSRDAVDLRATAFDVLLCRLTHQEGISPPSAKTGSSMTICVPLQAQPRVQMKLDRRVLWELGLAVGSIP